jgi:hypothetical protein
MDSKAGTGAEIMSRREKALNLPCRERETSKVFGKNFTLLDFVSETPENYG